MRQLSRDFPRVWDHPEIPATLRKQLLRMAIVEVIVERAGGHLAFTIHWAGNTCTKLTVQKRATPVGSTADPSLTDPVAQLAESLDDGEIARILNMKKLCTPRELPWTKDRVRAFRSHHRIRQGDLAPNPDILTGQQARDYLGIGYHGLTALIRRGAIHTNQVTDFAPWRLSRAELDSELVQSLVAALKRNGRLRGESPQKQRSLFAEKSGET